MNIETELSLDEMKANARQATAFLKSIGHEQRLLILCQLSTGERSVGDLAATLGLRQPTVSQHLARMKAEGLLTDRREGTSVYYSVQQTEILPIIEALYGVFCKPGGPTQE